MLHVPGGQPSEDETQGTEGPEHQVGQPAEATGAESDAGEAVPTPAPCPGRRSAL